MNTPTTSKWVPESNIVMIDLLVAQISNRQESTVLRITNTITMIDTGWFLMYLILIAIARVSAVGVLAVMIEHGDIKNIGQGVLENIMVINFARGIETTGTSRGIRTGTGLTMIVGDESLVDS